MTYEDYSICDLEAQAAVEAANIVRRRDLASYARRILHEVAPSTDEYEKHTWETPIKEIRQLLNAKAKGFDANALVQFANHMGLPVDVACTQWGGGHKYNRSGYNRERCIVCGDERDFVHSDGGAEGRVASGVCDGAPNAAGG